MAEYPRAFGQQGVRPGVALAGRSTAAIFDDGPSAGTICNLRAALSTASSLTVDSNCPVFPNNSDWAGSAAMVPGPLAGECTRPPIDKA